MEKKKSIPGAVVGIIGAILALIAGIALALCAEVVDTVSEGASQVSGADVETNYAWMCYVFGIGGGVCGLVGAILDFNYNIVGGIVQAVGLVLLVVLCIVFTYSILLIIAMVLLGIGALLSFVVKKPVEAAQPQQQQQVPPPPPQA